ncbi:MULTISPECIES: hypothetical protein [Pedobacter]|nr:MULTISPECIES: hypothetical protein [Pedobacter]HWW39809.1 hypothetical protein [Pedobacter sp.]
MNENLSYLLFFFPGTANSDQNTPIFSGKQITAPGIDVGHTSDAKEAQV